MSRGRHGVTSGIIVLVAAAVLAVPGVAQALKVTGATVHSATAVRVTFDRALTASAADPTLYAVTPGLSVTGAQLVDSGYAVLLQTSLQANALAYTVTVAGVRAANGETLSTGQARFIGTPLPANSKATGQDDFNRPSGYTASSSPLKGPWYARRVDAGNSTALVTSPSFVPGLGDRSFRSTVTTTDPEKDNASLYYALSGSEYYLSAYVFIPSGQGWLPGQQVGLLRLDQYFNTAHARLTAWYESPATYALAVDWKSTGNVYFSKLPGQGGAEQHVAAVPFDSWHWLQLHVRNGTSSDPRGLVEVWLDGELRYRRSDAVVFARTMTYAEVGIMHMVSRGPDAVTYTDQVRLGRSPQLPSQ
jgi:hypothetical protein